MKQHNTFINKYRNKKAARMIYRNAGDDHNGVFSIPAEGYALSVIASDGGGWDHVSVSRTDGETPTWNDMCRIKDLFFDAGETVVQFHPKKSEYVNTHAGCLHLWKKQGQEIELPPQIFV